MRRSTPVHALHNAKDPNFPTPESWDLWTVAWSPGAAVGIEEVTAESRGWHEPGGGAGPAAQPRRASRQPSDAEINGRNQWTEINGDIVDFAR